MKIKKENLTILVIVILLVIFTVIFALVIFYSFSSKPNNALPTTITPVKNQAQSLRFDMNAQHKLLEYLSSPKPLIKTDSDIRGSLLKSLNGASGVVYSSANVEIDYIKSADLFQGRITTKNFELAKQESVNWLKQKGLSQTGICNLPLMFYVSWDISEQSVGAFFSPLPPGC